jgi:hypothetical protein
MPRWHGRLTQRVESDSQAEYAGDLKLAPEATELANATTPARRRRDHRRALAQSGAGADAEAEVSTPSSPKLAGLRAWSQERAAKDARRLLVASGAALPEQYALSVELIAGQSAAVYKQIFDRWPGQLGSVLGYSGPSQPCWPKAAGMALLTNTAYPALRIYLCEEVRQPCAARRDACTTSRAAEPRPCPLPPRSSANQLHRTLVPSTPTGPVRRHAVARNARQHDLGRAVHGHEEAQLGGWLAHADGCAACPRLHAAALLAGTSLRTS